MGRADHRITTPARTGAARGHGFCLAMAHAQVGGKDPARPWLARACAATARTTVGKPARWCLRAEAGQRLGLPRPADRPDQGG